MNDNAPYYHPPSPDAGAPYAPHAPAPASSHWAPIAHVSGLSALVIGLGFIGPLVVLAIRKEHPVDKAHAKAAFNFQLSWLLWQAVATVGAVVLAMVTLGLALLVALPAIFSLAVAWFVITVLATVRAGNGTPYKYPLTVNFLK